MPALVVAMAGKPASSTTRAVATSQAFGNTRRRGPWCRARNAWAFSCGVRDGIGGLAFLGRRGGGKFGEPKTTGWEVPTIVSPPPPPPLLPPGRQNIFL